MMKSSRIVSVFLVGMAFFVPEILSAEIEGLDDVNKDYRPAAYEPSAGIDMVHNRIGGGKSVADLVEIGTENTDGLQEYVISLAIFPAGITLAFIIWFVAICCCAKCCCKNMCSAKVSALLILALSGVSCFGWFYSIGGNTQFSGGITDVLDAIKMIGEHIDGSVAEVDGVLSYLGEISTLTEKANSDCLDTLNQIAQDTGTNINIEFPTEVIDEAIDAANGSFAEVVAQLDDINDVLSDGIDEVTSQVEGQQRYHTLVVVLFIVIIGLFAATTAYRSFDELPGANSSFAGSLRKGSATVLFTVGIVLLLVALVLAALFSIAGSIGADICAPSPTQNIQDILSQQVTPPFENGADEFCASPEYQPVCYIQTCEGGNPLQNEVDFALNQTRTIVEPLEVFKTEINQAIVDAEQAVGTIPGSQQCQDSLTAAIDRAQDITDEVGEVEKVIACNNINPIYIKLVNEGLCDGIVSGIITTFITMTMACMSLMAAMFVYCTLQYQDKFEYSTYDKDIPQAQEVAGYKNNNKV